MQKYPLYAMLILFFYILLLKFNLLAKDDGMDTSLDIQIFGFVNENYMVLMESNCGDDGLHRIIFPEIPQEREAINPMSLGIQLRNRS